MVEILLVQGADLNCKLDSGAQANVISRVTYEGLQKPPAMRPTSSCLVAYNNYRIKPLGVVRLAVDVMTTSRQLDFYIVSDDVSTIIGLPLYSTGLNSTREHRHLSDAINIAEQ